jgi:N-acetyl-gamma-glutamyl-phosphate reductase
LKNLKIRMIKVGIVGGAGYTGGELLRILANHPQIDMKFIHSKSNAGNPIWQVHKDLIGETDWAFTDELDYQNIHVLFLCMGHGDSKVFLTENPTPPNVKIIDLSQDFRIKNTSEGFVYGLPELNKQSIREASKIANPGCFATAIQLALLPLASAQRLHEDVQISAITGSTGAGQSLSPTSHFSWRSNNISVYKAFTHQHLGEIRQSVVQLQSDFDKRINFVPLRGDFARGILATVFMPCDLTLEKAQKLYEDFYATHPFTVVTSENPDLKMVVNSNKCVVYLEKQEDMLLIITAIDNLIKGASGQAVQNMNLMFGLDETIGLRLKASYF